MSASCVAFSICTGFVKCFLKTIRNKKKKHDKIVNLARGKSNSTESKISEALVNNEISHEDFMAILNEEKKYRELKALEWWITKEVMLKKLVWLKKVKKWVLMKSLGVMKLLITV